MRKAQGLSLNYVVVGVIALVVLVVIVLVFTNRMRPFIHLPDNVPKTCKNYGGIWKETCGANEYSYIAVEDADEHAGYHCCVPKDFNARCRNRGGSVKPLGRNPNCEKVCGSNKVFESGKDSNGNPVCCCSS